jgi:hypothetical protein
MLVKVGAGKVDVVRLTVKGSDDILRIGSRA